MILPDNGIPLPIHTLMTQIGTIFGPKRRWTDYEVGLLAEICRHEECFDECTQIVEFHSKLSSGSKMFPMSVARLLENWGCVLDRARIHAKPKTCGPVKDPIALRRAKMLAEMALIRSRDVDPDNRVWYAGTEKSKARFFELKKELEQMEETK